jgi:Protein of unknown function (DUF3551)
MRAMISAMLVLGAITAAAPARAQTYAPGYPVCLHVYGIVTYWECLYTSMAQCNATASGRAAQCAPNPYLAYASAPPARTPKRVRPVY